MKFSYGIHPALVGPTAFGNSCCRVRELEATLWRLGWLARIHSVGERPVQVNASVSSARSATVVVASMSQSLDIVGRTKLDTFAVVMPRGSTRILINDRKVAPGDALVLPPGQPVVAHSGSNAKVLLVMLPNRALILDQVLEADQSRRLQSREPVKIDGNCDTGRRFRNRFIALLAETSDQRNYRFSQDTSVTTRPGAWSHPEVHSSDDPNDRIIRHAVNFVESHLTESLSVVDLIECASTSRSKLERTFRRTLDMTPSQYILARRLARARHQLAVSDPQTSSVASIALDSGFSHLGRFSGAYFRRYDELPRETLHAT